MCNTVYWEIFMYENIHVLDVCVINFHGSFTNFVKLETTLYMSCCMIKEITYIHIRTYYSTDFLNKSNFKKPGMGLA